MAMEIEAARLLIWKAAWAKDNTSKILVLLASMAKVYSSEVAMKASTTVCPDSWRLWLHKRDRS